METLRPLLGRSRRAILFDDAASARIRPLVEGLIEAQRIRRLALASLSVELDLIRINDSGINRVRTYLREPLTEQIGQGNLRVGEVHAPLGENGAGKSTLMKILCGILPPSEGAIRSEGREQRFANYAEAIAGIGIVLHEFSPIPHLHAIEKMFLVREIRSRPGLPDRKAMRAQARAIMHQLGVEVALDVPVSRLSVAEQQSGEIARTLSLRARILVLDQPTATLTPPRSSSCSRSCASCAGRA